MFELEVHGGLGRKGTWTRSGQTLTTPLVLFVPTRAHPAPPYAEALFVSDRTEDPRLQIRVSGSFFGPREGRHPDDVPPSKGTPLSMADLEFPEEPPAGDLAIVVPLAVGLILILLLVTRRRPAGVPTPPQAFLRCLACGATNPTYNRFCTNCGQPIGGPPR